MQAPGLFQVWYPFISYVVKKIKQWAPFFNHEITSWHFTGLVVEAN